MTKPSRSTPARPAGLARLSATSSRSDSPAPASHTEHEPVAAAEIPLHSALTEVAAGAGTEQPRRGVTDTERDSPRQKIDLGLDGSVLHSAVLEASRRPPPRRPVVTQDVWSERAVRTAVERLPFHEGSALLTFEWDAEGRLQSLVASAQSSGQNHWQTLADSLHRKLAMHPNRSVQKRGLRLVYLIRSEIVKPLNQRSVLPESKHASLETLTDEQLYPINTLNIGVKADTRSPNRRVISITLASSQAL